MLEKDKFLEKINYFFFIIVIIFSQNLFADSIKSKIISYNNSLKNSSAVFIQSDGKDLQEGVIYFGMDRIKIDYTKPEKLTLILSEKKGIYTNHSLKESQFFNTKKTYIKIFFKLLKGQSFSEKMLISKNSIELRDSFVLNDNQYKIKIIYEDGPIKLRKIIILENKEKTEIGFLEHNDLKNFKTNFFSMIDPYLN